MLTSSEWYALGVGEQRRTRDVPLGGGEEQDVGARAVHLVRLTRMNRFLLHRLDADSVELLVKHLSQTPHTIFDIFIFYFSYFMTNSVCLLPGKHIKTKHHQAPMTNIVLLYI